MYRNVTDLCSLSFRPTLAIPKLNIHIKKIGCTWTRTHNILASCMYLVRPLIKLQWVIAQPIFCQASYPPWCKWSARWAGNSEIEAVGSSPNRGHALSWKRFHTYKTQLTLLPRLAYGLGYITYTPKSNP